MEENGYANFEEGHNPYFNRWFSAIPIQRVMLRRCICHNPYFNRWFSAILDDFMLVGQAVCHNPYFNRWFSAICLLHQDDGGRWLSQSLF